MIVGRIAGAFGATGEVKVDLETDNPERFAVGSRLFLKGTPVTVERARESGPERLVVKLSGVDDREHAKELQGVALEVPEDEVPPLPPGSYYRFQILGLETWSDKGAYLGAVEDIFPTGSNDVLVIRAPGRPDLLVPNTTDLTEIDLDAHRLTVRVVPGLLPEGGVSREKE